MAAAGTGFSPERIGKLSCLEFNYPAPAAVSFVFESDTQFKCLDTAPDFSGRPIATASGSYSRPSTDLIFAAATSAPLPHSIW